MRPARVIGSSSYCLSCFRDTGVVNIECRKRSAQSLTLCVWCIKKNWAQLSRRTTNDAVERALRRFQEKIKI